MRKLKVAVIQSPGEPADDHMAWLAGQVGEAGRQGAQLVLLPELFAMPYCFDPVAWSWATPQGGKIEAFLRSTAKQAGLFLGGSYLEASGSDFFNTFALAGPGGEIVGRVGKAHPCSFERCLFAPAPGAQVITCDLGRIGVAICYDNALREVVDRLLAGRPELWLMPMSAPMPPFSLAGKAGITRYRRELFDSPAEMARHYGIPVLLANKSGPWVTPMPGWLPPIRSYFPGGSRIVDSDGCELALVGEAPGMCCAAVTLDSASQRLFVPPAFDGNRPWVTPPLLDYRLFPLYEWWGQRYYRRHPLRPRKAQERSANHESV